MQSQFFIIPKFSFESNELVNSELTLQACRAGVTNPQRGRYEALEKY